MTIRWKLALPLFFITVFSLGALKYQYDVMQFCRRAHIREPKSEVFACQRLMIRPMTQQEIEDADIFMYECGSAGWPLSGAERIAAVAGFPGDLVALKFARFLFERFAISMIPTSFFGTILFTFILQFGLGTLIDRGKRKR